MELSADVRAVGHGPGDLRREVLGMGGDEPDPFDAFDPAHHPQQTGEILPRPRVPVGIHVLAEKLDLPVSVRGEVQDLCQNAVHRPALLPAPAEGNDAVGAEIVAAFHDRNVGADAAFPEGFGGPDLVPGAVPARLEEPAFPLSREERGEFMIMIGADDEVDLGPFFEQLLAADLGDAAQDADDLVPHLS